jgi:hypothetical protein
MKINILTLFFFIIFIVCSCTLIPISDEGSKLLEDGLWRLYIDDLRFGRNVDIYNNTAIVSAKGDSIASVRVFEFDQNNWTNTAFLTEENVTQNYGSELVVGNNIIAISDYDNNKIYTYIKSDTIWEKLGTIIPTNESNFSNFGKSLDIYENYLIVGSETGPAVLYEHINDDWLEIWSLDVGEPQEDQYEIDVSISENFLATCKGRDVYIYNRSGGNLSNRTLIDSSSNTNHSYYYRIDLDDSTLVVGDPKNLNNYCNIMTYEFENNNWTKDTTIEWFIEREDFGSKIEICSDHILFSVLPLDYFSSNYFVFYELNSTKRWIFKETISRSSYMRDFALTNEFAIISGSRYAYIYEYK